MRPVARRRGRILAVTAGLTGFLAVFAMGAQAEPLPVARADVNGHAVTVSAEWPVVADALAAAGIAHGDGRLLSAGTQKVLDPHHDRATLHVDDRPAKTEDPVRDGARIRVHVGIDAIEAVAKRAVPVPGKGPPDVENELWHLPKPGLRVETYGVVSDEVVTSHLAAAPTDATPDTSPTVALTFDDGPDPLVTPVLLDLLQALDVKATFCVVGYAAKRHPDIVRAIAARGHGLCNHTASHVVHLDRRPHSEQVAQIQGGFDTIKEITGTAPAFYRAPGGTLSPAIVHEARTRGMRVLHWTLDTEDYRPTPAPILLLKTVAAVRPGAVILMHDGGGDGRNTVDMIQALVTELRARGYGFRLP